MKTYLSIYDVDTDDNELIIKVEPLYCADRDDEILNVTSNDYVPSKGDRLYFLPGVNIPRVKLKDLSLQHAIKTTRNIDDATHVFAGRNTKDKMVSGSWKYTIRTDSLRAILADSTLVMDDYYKENLNQALEFYTEDIVLIEYGYANMLKNASFSCVQNNINGISRSSNMYYTVDEDYKELFPDIMSLDVYNEGMLLKHINGDGAAIIDETMFLQISDMFKSSDTDNHIIAMEIMANSNYMESLLYIEMLFENYANRMHNCHTKNHVNFKSLLSFLGKSNNYMNTDVDDVIKSLITKEVLDIEKINIIMKYYGQRIADGGGNDYFEVKTITLNEETAKLLNTNYVHELVPDFIPEEGIELPEIHGDLVDLNSLEDNNPGFDDVCNESAEEEELADEDIEDAFTNIVRNELKSELIASEEEIPEPEIETNKEPIEETDNNQTTQTKDDDFEWF